MTMTAEEIKKKKLFIYMLIALGFAGLIGAHEVSGSDEHADTTLPLLLAMAGTLCFAAAGWLARRLMRQISS
jgi:hypothetical protein